MKQLLYYGQTSLTPQPKALQAGPINLEFIAGGLRRISLGERLMIARIYFAIRDRHWITVPYQINDLVIDESADGFSICYQACCVDPTIDLHWKAEINGNVAGMLTFEIYGKVGKSCEISRASLNILHPAQECSGQPCQVEHVNGSLERSIFPVWPAPYQPFTEIQAIRHQVQQGIWCQVRVKGDVFEMEDQRNWTDASFKIYCPPLNRPYPLALKAGQEIYQACSLNLQTSVPLKKENRAPANRQVSIHIQNQSAGCLPGIGVGMSSREAPLSDSQIHRLRRLKLDHLRVDLYFSNPCWKKRWQQALDLAHRVDIDLEVALYLNQQAAPQIDAFARLLADQLCDNSPGIIRRWIVFHENEYVAPPGWLVGVLQEIQSKLPCAPIAGGTDVYFVHINRQAPEPATLNQLCFSINPQVHSSDNEHLFETLAMQGLLIRAARRLCPTLPIVISPLTLKPRFNPHIWMRCEESDSEYENCHDPRLQGLLGASWSLGSLVQLAENGAFSATYFECIGQGGLLSINQNAVHPVYFVFAGIADFHGGEILPLDNSNPEALAGLALSKGNRLRVICANLTDRPLSATLHGLNGLARAYICDETNLSRAMVAPDDFLCSPGTKRWFAHDDCTIDLKPFALAWFDFNS